MTPRHHVHAHARRRHITCLAALLALCFPLQILADAQTHTSPHPATLSELWLEQPTQPAAVAYAYYWLEAHREPHRQQGLRLIEELATLSNWHALAGRKSLARSALEWQQTIIGLQDKAGRTPARADLASLLASPRHDPTLASLADAGYCTVPDWVEVWHFDGVSRQRWKPGLGLRGLLRSLPSGQWSMADEAWVIAPLGAPRRIGVAAWNAGNSALVPGTRIVLALPGSTQEADWVNRNLPAYLATRLPSDTCQSITLAGREPMAKGEAAR